MAAFLIILAVLMLLGYLLYEDHVYAVDNALVTVEVRA